MSEKEKIKYVDFKSISGKKNQKSSAEKPLHTNPLIDRLFKFTHAKLAKKDYKSFSDFNPDDLM